MTLLTRWFDIENLNTPFLAINLSNRKSGSKETNAKLFPLNQTGHWWLPKAALDHGIKDQPIVLFYSDKGTSTLYVGTCTEVEISPDKMTKDRKPRHILTVKAWKDVGETSITFSAFFDGFPLSSNPTVLWATPDSYKLPDSEALGIDDGDDGWGEKEGHDQLGISLRRVNHKIFVARLNRKWEGKCALTGMKASRLVQACHIIPWNVATVVERVSADNGLLLCAHLHVLFDSHLLGFNSEGCLLLSPELSKDVRTLVLAVGKTQLRHSPTPKQVRFLERHQDTARQKGHQLLPV